MVMGDQISHRTSRGGRRRNPPWGTATSSTSCLQRHPRQNKHHSPGPPFPWARHRRSSPHHPHRQRPTIRRTDSYQGLQYTEGTYRILLHDTAQSMWQSPGIHIRLTATCVPQPPQRGASRSSPVSSRSYEQRTNSVRTALEQRTRTRTNNARNCEKRANKVKNNDNECGLVRTTSRE
jgi:hypothetical protein